MKLLTILGVKGRLMVLLQDKTRELTEYLKRKLGEKKFLISVLKENKEYMISGKYRVTWAGKRKIYIKNSNTKDFLLRNSRQSNDSSLFRIKMLADAISTTFFTITIKDREEPSIKGEMLMMTYSNNVKIIDFTRKIILNKMAADPLTYKRIRQGHQKMEDHFRMTILEFVDDEFMYLEKYLEFTPFSRWQAEEINKCLNDIFGSYFRYFSTTEPAVLVYRNPAKMLRELKETAYGNHKLVAKIEEFLKESSEETVYPIIRSHGDMKFENILLSDGNFHIIDLEFSADHFFIYDLINLIFNEGMKGDFSFVRRYLHGEFDEMFKMLFNIFSIDFDYEKKIYYIAVYLIDRILHYDLQLTFYRFNMIEMWNEYFLVLSRIEELKNSNSDF